MSWGPLFVTLAVAGLVIVAMMAVVLGLSLRARNWSIIDTFWGLGFVAVAISSYVLSNGEGDGGRRLVALVVPVVWGLRLAGYLHWRNHGQPEDPRYTAHMRRRTGALVPYVVRTIFAAQGSVLWIVAIPITVAMFEHRGIDAITWIGVALAAVGLFFETVGDLQLARFRADPANAGLVMDRGLWSWTRHPNYFGDVCVMFSFWLIACGSWWGVLTIVSPLLMTYSIVNKTGKKLLERRMAKSRGADYEAYVARTSGLIPRPPRRLPPTASR